MEMALDRIVRTTVHRYVVEVDKKLKMDINQSDEAVFAWHLELSNTRRLLVIGSRSNLAR